MCVFSNAKKGQIPAQEVQRCLIDMLIIYFNKIEERIKSFFDYICAQVKPIDMLSYE